MGFILVTGLFFALGAHEGHEESVGVWQERGYSWTQWIGKYHYLAVHFPIALISMALLAESLAIWFPNPLFSHSARFMLITSALWTIPTVLLGWALSRGAVYEGETETVFQLHWILGCLTLFLSFFTVFIREKYREHGGLYYGLLIMLFLSMYWGAVMGTQLTFNF